MIEGATLHILLQESRDVRRVPCQHIVSTSGGIVELDLADVRSLLPCKDLCASRRIKSTTSYIPYAIRVAITRACYRRGNVSKLAFHQKIGINSGYSGAGHTITQK